jgi:hypothetical protein
MIQKISERVEVGMSTSPKWVKWKNKVYQIEKIGLHHSFRQGRVLYHAFSVASRTLFFRLILDTETLSWNLEEISDGLPA